MSDTFSKVEVITGVARRRRFSTDLKLAVIAETMQPGMSISYVARRHGLSPSLVFRWRRLMSEGGKEAVRADDEVVAASEVRRLEERVRDLERLLGRKTMEVEMLKEALDLARAKKTDVAVALAATRRYPMTRIASTLGVARSNLIERRDGARPKRGPQERPGDLELTADIRRLVDERATYGYRRIAALLKRKRRADGMAPVNAKRVYRLMKKHGLVLERHTGRRRPREHDGQVATIRSNCRWCSDALEFSCWNGEVVRVAFALDCHDREIIAWTATTSGISGEMIRDMMVDCVERRFGAIRAPHPVQWLSPHDLGPGRIHARTLSRRLVARRALSLRYADRRFRDLSSLRGLHCSDLGYVHVAVCGGKRELPRRPRAFHSARGDARVPGRDARSSNLPTHGQLDACRGAALESRAREVERSVRRRGTPIGVAIVTSDGYRRREESWRCASRSDRG
jgi:transposase-like protein